MNSVPRQVQIGVVTAGYLAVALAATALVYLRHLQYVTHPQDAIAYGTMWGFGDWLLGLFIGGLFLIPTLLLALVIRGSEPAYTRYSQFVLGLGVTAPICAGLFFVPAVGQTNNLLASICMYRVAGSPIILIGMGGSRLLARFRPAKRLTSCALLLETGTIAVLLAMLVL